MPQYIFTYNEKDNSFPERYRMVTDEDDVKALCETENLTGTFLNTEAIELLDKIQARCQSDESLLVEFVDAPSWSFIEERFNPAEAEKQAREKQEKNN